MVLTLSRQFVTLTGTGKAVRVFFFFVFFSNATTCSYEISWFPSWLWR